MGKLLDRNSELARRCKDLSPIAGQVRDIIWQGNKSTIMSGTSPGSTRKVAPLAPSTLARRKGNGPPRAPMGEASRVISDCQVSVLAGPGRLSYTKSWPALGEIARYLNDGTKRMPGRPFFGYREIDREKIAGLMREYIIKPGFFGRLFGRG